VTIAYDSAVSRAPAAAGGAAAHDTLERPLAQTIYGPLVVVCMLMLAVAAFTTIHHVHDRLYGAVWRIAESVATKTVTEGGPLSPGLVHAHEGPYDGLILRSVEVLEVPDKGPVPAAGRGTRTSLETALAAVAATGAPQRVVDHASRRVAYLQPFDPGPDGVPRRVVAVDMDTGGIEAQVAHFRTVAIVGILAIGLVVLLTCIVLTQRVIVRPLMDLKTVIAKAQFDPTVADTYSGPREFEAVTAAFQRVVYDLHDKRARAEAIAKHLIETQAELEAALEKERDWAASRALYQASFEAGGVGIVLFDDSFAVIDVNATACRLTGYEREDLIGRDKLFLVHPDDRERERVELARMRDGAIDAFDIERRGLRPDGTVYHVVSRVRAISDAANGVHHFVAFLTDMTDSKRQEAEIRASLLRQEALVAEQRIFRYIFDSNLVGMSISSPEEPRGTVNARYCEITGYSKAELKHLTWRELTHPDDLARAIEVVEGAVEGRSPEFSERLRFIRKDGEVVTVQLEGRCQRDASGEIQWFAVLAQDVTEQCRAEAERSKALESLKFLLANIPDGVVELDDDGRIVSANASFLKMFSVTERQALASRITRFIPDFEFASLGEVRFFTGDTRGMTNDGTEIDIGYNCKRREVDGREVFTLIVYDNSMIRQLIEQLEAARDDALSSARVKSAFLANMSHELRTPLNGVLGMLNLLSTTDPTPEQDDYIRTAARSGEHLLSIISDLLDYSKLEAQELRLERIPFDPRPMAEDVVELLGGRAFDKGVDIVQVVAADVPEELEGDPGRLRQILMNLVGNAVKFTDEGEIRLEITRSGASGAANARLRIDVHDTGVGIPADMHEQVFESFVQADDSTTRTHGGTGLGLSITRQLVELMGGTIALTSEPGNGTTFTAELPLRVATPRQAAALGSPASDLDGLRIAVCDTSVATGRAIAETLTPLGVTVHTLVDFDDVPAWLERSVAAGDPPDVLVVDFHGGVRSAQRLVTHLVDEARVDPRTILALTAPGRGADNDAATALPLGGVLRKPVRRARLVEALTGLIGGDMAFEAESARAVDVPSAPGPARILAVDDVPVNLAVVAGMLRHAGHEVETAESGAAAIAAFERGAHDLVLLDCQMPGMDGFEVTARLRASGDRGGRVPIVAMTAAAGPEQCAALKAAGMDAVLPKPVSPEDLADLLATWLPGAPQTNVTPIRLDGDDRSAAGSDDPETLIDRRKVDEIAHILGDEAFDELLAMFETETRARLRSLEDAIAAGDADATVAPLHSLKGASRNVGASVLGSLASELEHGARAGDIEALTAGVSRLVDVAETTLTALARRSEAPAALA